MTATRLYFRYLSISLRSQMQYRASFFMQLIANLTITLAEFLGVWALYARFGNLTGWTLPQAAVLYGMADTAFAIAEAVPRGFDIFPDKVKSGDFDRILLRPRRLAFQILAQEMQLMRLGRLSQSLVILAWGTSAAGIDWNLPRAALLLFAILGGAALFSGLFVLLATLSFWTTEALELMNIATYGGSYASYYPLSIYRPWFRLALTFVLPLATINYLPAHAIMNRVEPLFHTPLALQYAAPLTGFIFLALTLQVWKIGVRHYRSTGS